MRRIVWTYWCICNKTKTGKRYYRSGRSLTVFRDSRREAWQFSSRDSASRVRKDILAAIGDVPLAKRLRLVKVTVWRKA